MLSTDVQINKLSPVVNPNHFLPVSILKPLKGVDDNYVTDAEKIVIGNTSGENTGDQVIPVSGVDFDPVGTDNSRSPSPSQNSKLPVAVMICLTGVISIITLSVV